MQYGLTYILQLFCFLLHSGHMRFGWATMYDDDYDDSGRFFKRIMLREVQQDCDEDILLNYLAKLQAVNPESIINLAVVKHLTTFCSTLDKEVMQMDDYLKTCNPPTQRNIYYDLIRGIKAFDDKVCKDKEFQKEFMKFTECFGSLQEEYELCAGPDDWTENLDDEQTCKIYGDIVLCYKTATVQACGEEAADIMVNFMKSVINRILTVKCNSSAEATQVPEFLEGNQPELKGKSTAISLIPLFVILSIIIFIIVVYTTSKCMKIKREEIDPEKKDLQ